MRETGLSDPDSSPDLSQDAFLGGAVLLRQPVSGYRAAVDPVFLAAAVRAASGSTVLDVGCGHGTAAICLASRVPGLRITGIECQADLVRLANENARLNDLAEQVEVVHADIMKGLPGVAPANFDHVMANPPFLDATRNSPPAGKAKSIARLESEARLDDWIDFMIRMTRPRGSLTLIQRTDRLDEVILSLRQRVGEITVFPLWPKAGAPAKRFLLQARKGVRTPMRLMAGMVVHRSDDRFTPEADAVLRGAALDIGSAKSCYNLPHDE